MSRLMLFLGGALVGAAGLATAALLNEKSSGTADSLRLGNVNALDADGLVKQLNSFFFKADALTVKCLEVVMDSFELQIPPELPDDGIFMRAGNAICGKMTIISRKCKQSALIDIKKEAEELYAKFRGVFVKANSLLEQRGMQKVSCKKITFGGQDFSLNNALSNDDWLDELNELADKIRNYLNAATAVSEQLISSLQRLQDENAAACGETPAALPA